MTWMMDGVLLLQLLALCCLFSAQVLGEGEPKCIYRGPETIAQKRLEEIQGRRFKASDDLEDGFDYTIGICTPAEPDDTPPGSDWKNVAVVQRKKKDPENSAVAIGRFNDTQVMMGTDWIFLTYGSGKAYGSHCGKEQRQAHIMITCEEGETKGVARILEENADKNSSCYYLFEVDHVVACPIIAQSSSLSLGSIIVIISMVVVGVYLIGGFIYQRFVAGAKGLEQIPNYGFWQDFGNLQADGCNFVCRCGYLPFSEPREYRGMGDEQLPAADDDDMRDDHLLPM